MTKKEKIQTWLLLPVVLGIALIEPIWIELVEFWKRSELKENYKDNFLRFYDVYFVEVWEKPDNETKN